MTWAAGRDSARVFSSVAHQTFISHWRSLTSNVRYWNSAVTLRSKQSLKVSLRELRISPTSRAFTRALRLRIEQLRAIMAGARDWLAVTAAAVVAGQHGLRGMPWNELAHQTGQGWIVAQAAAQQIGAIAWHATRLIAGGARNCVHVVSQLPWRAGRDRARQAWVGAGRFSSRFVAIAIEVTGPQPWRYIGVGVSVIAFSGLGAGVVVMALNWQMITRYGFGPLRSNHPSTTVAQLAPVETPASISLSRPAVMQPIVGTPEPILPSASLTVAQTGQSTSASSTVVTVLPTPTSQPTAEPSEAEIWSTVAPQVEAAWGMDAHKTITLLEGFLVRFPDYAPAREKLYAALLAHAEEVRATGDIAGATDQAQRAFFVLPDRGEARALLVALASAEPSSSATVEASREP